MRKAMIEIEEYKKEKQVIRRKYEALLEEYVTYWISKNPNYRLVAGNGTWYLETKYKHTDKWVKVEEDDDCNFYYLDEECDDLSQIKITGDWADINETLLDWSCENIYIAGDFGEF